MFGEDPPHLRWARRVGCPRLRGLSWRWLRGARHWQGAARRGLWSSGWRVPSPVQSSPPPLPRRAVKVGSVGCQGYLSKLLPESRARALHENNPVAVAEGKPCRSRGVEFRAASRYLPQLPAWRAYTTPILCIVS